MRIAAASYLNSLPLLDGLDVASCPPSEGARRLAEGEVDVALVPLAAVARAGDWVVVPDLCVAAHGAVESVLLVSECPPESIEVVAVDASSRTSAVLARVVLAARGIAPRWETRPPGELGSFVGGRRAAVIIGDAALVLSGTRTFPTRIDLGAAWQELTGLPMVFAVFAARDHETAMSAAPILRAAAERGTTPAALARLAAATTAVSADTARRYLGRLHWRLGPRELAGAQEFLRRGADLRLLPRTVLQFCAMSAGITPPGMSAGITPPAMSAEITPPVMSAEITPPVMSAEITPTAMSADPIGRLLDRGARGERLSAGELRLLHDHADLPALGAAAHARRLALHPAPVVTYIVDRNINYTNVCTTACRFCAFFRPVGHGEGYVLDREELAAKMTVLRDAGGIQILLQGGLNPDLPLGWYEDLFRWMKAQFPGIALHALSPEEILHLARLSDTTIEDILGRLVAAGLDSVPGGGAEILVDRIRKRIAALKCTSYEWLEVMRVAHRLGLRSSATMMYAIGETARDRIEHLLKLRDLQDETGGFTAFICWPFQPGNTKLAGDDATASAPMYLRQVAIARLALDNIPNLQASWPTMGPAVGQVALAFGANDFGSVMFEENVVSSAGTIFSMDAAAIERHIAAAGFQPRRRNMRYEAVA